MPAPQDASLPPFFTLTNGYTVRVTAQDPTDGSVASSVVASNVSISVNQIPSVASAGLPPDALLVPAGGAV